MNRIKKAKVSFIQNMFLPDWIYCKKCSSVWKERFINSPFAKNNLFYYDEYKRKYRENPYILGWGKLRFDKSLFDNVICSDDGLKPVQNFGSAFGLGVVDVNRKVVLDKKKLKSTYLKFNRDFKIRIHVYTFGFTFIFVNCSFHFTPAITVDDFIKLVRRFISRNNVLKLECGGKSLETIYKISSKIQKKVIKSSIQKRNRKETTVSKSPGIYTTIFLPFEKGNPYSFSEREIIGLLNMDSNYMRLQDNYVKNYFSSSNSNFALYKGELITLGSRGLLVSFPDQRSSLKYYWNLISILEFCLIQKHLFGEYKNRLEQSCIEILKANWTAKNRIKYFHRLSLIDFTVLDFLKSLLNFPNNYKAKYRKWHYMVSETIGVKNRREELKAQIDNYIKTAEKWEPPIKNLLLGLQGLISKFS